MDKPDFQRRLITAVRREMDSRFTRLDDRLTEMGARIEQVKKLEGPPGKNGDPGKDGESFTIEHAAPLIERAIADQIESHKTEIKEMAAAEIQGIQMPDPAAYVAEFSNELCRLLDES